MCYNTPKSLSQLIGKNQSTAKIFKWADTDNSGTMNYYRWFRDNELVHRIHGQWNTDDTDDTDDSGTMNYRWFRDNELLQMIQGQWNITDDSGTMNYRWYRWFRDNELLQMIQGQWTIADDSGTMNYYRWFRDNDLIQMIQGEWTDANGLTQNHNSCLKKKVNIQEKKSESAYRNSSLHRNLHQLPTKKKSEFPVRTSEFY